MKNLIKKSLTYGSVAVAALGSQAVLAIDTAAVTTAQTDGAAAVDLTTTGLIGIVAVIVGVTMVLSLLKKA